MPRSSSRKTMAISAKWRKLFRLIPGYDPIATAGQGHWFDAATADRAVAFFETYLTHVEGKLAGKPFILSPWQQALIGCVFGWKQPDGRRRYREVLQYVPRKNGKTSQCGGLVNLVAFCDNEPGAQIYAAASEREQAALVFRQARGMILQNPELASKCKPYASFKSIEYPGLVTFKALSADATTKHGFNSHLVIFDELHAQPNRDLADVLLTSTGSRRQPLIWYITTADFMRDSICNEKYEYACDVRNGTTNDPAFLPCIFEALPTDDWKDPKVWAKANPNLGVSISLEYLARECQRAQDLPSYENTFKRLHLNIRTSQDVRWIPDDLWMSCAGAVNIEELTGRDAFLGLDFGWRDDYAALVAVVPDGDILNALAWFWLPTEGRRDKSLPPAADFIRQGLVTLTEGNATDIDAIYAKIRELRERFTIRCIALDPSNARKQGQDLQNMGFEVREFVQSKGTYNEPCRALEAALKDRKLRHGGHPLMRWMASNVQIEENGLGQIMPKKKRSAEKIDGICALVMGIGAMLGAESAGPSVYEGRGLLEVRL